MRIFVSDYGATPEAGGVFSVLADFYHDVLHDDRGNEWIFLLAGKYFQTSNNVKIITRSDLKNSRLKKLWFELFNGRHFINHYHPDAFISLQNISTIGVASKIKLVYLHQSIPFFTDHLFSFWQKEERRVAFYQRLVGKVIKFSLSHERPLTIVQTKWMQRAVVDQTRLPIDHTLVVSPKVPTINDQRLFNNHCHHCFFYPATAYVYKNQRVILEAARILQRDGIQNFHVDLTLTKSQCPTINQHINLRGYLPREKVLRMYESHVLIFPSYIESFGLPLLEAAQKADIILAADIPVAHEVLGDYPNAYYFDYRRPDQLADLMKKVISGQIKSDGQPIKLHYRNESLLTTVNMIIDKGRD